jgi:hypothetical protein
MQTRHNMLHKKIQSLLKSAEFYTNHFITFEIFNEREGKQILQFNICSAISRLSFGLIMLIECLHKSLLAKLAS